MESKFESSVEGTSKTSGKGNGCNDEEAIKSTTGNGREIAFDGNVDYMGGCNILQVISFYVHVIGLYSN